MIFYKCHFYLYAAWNKKWSDTFSKGGEYGSLLGALKDGLEESTEIANVHVAVQSKLFETVQHIQDWKSDSYHKGIMGWKETKKCDEGFSKAHKPWLKKYDDSKLKFGNQNVTLLGLSDCFYISLSES